MEQNVNSQTNILRAWHRVEFFQPYTIPESLNEDQNAKRIARTELEQNRSDALPWLDGNTREAFGIRPNIHVNYNIYLGVFSKAWLKRLVDEKFDEFFDENDKAEFNERLDSDGDTCYAKLRVDEMGVPDFENMSVSTLPWALGKLDTGGIRELSLENFDVRCNQLMTYVNDRLLGLLRPHPYNEDIKVVTPALILQLLRLLNSWAKYEPPEQQEFVIAIDWFEVSEKKSRFNPVNALMTRSATSAPVSEHLSPDSSKVCGPDAKKRRDPVIGEEKDVADEDDDEEEKDNCSARILPILNSFYIEDIEKAINLLNSGDCHTALQQYLTGTSKKLADLYTQEGLQLIRQKLQLKHTPLGRWPSDPSHNMSLMQQFAINVAFDELRDGGLLSINGPPGTGKTTLLRDIVAQNVVARAKVLSGFDTVLSSLDSQGFPDNSLFGYEMVVASSNNAAVENVSRELPLKSSVDTQTFDVSYMESVANQQFANARKKNGRSRLLPMAEDEHCWGNIAAVLGRQKNRKKFINRLFYYEHWRDEADMVQRTEDENYLGFWKWINLVSGRTDTVSKHSDECDEPLLHDKNALNAGANHLMWLSGRRDSVKSFADARLEFLQKLNEFNAIQAELEEYLSLKNDLGSEANALQLTALSADLQDKQSDQKSLSTDAMRTEDELVLVQEKIDVAAYDLKQAEADADSFVSEDIEQLQHELMELKRSGIAHRESLKHTRKKMRKLEQQIEALQGQQEQLESDLHATQARFACLKKQFAGMRIPQDGEHIADDELQRNAYWQNPAINKLRSEIFCKAIALHEAWLVEASKNQSFKENVLLKIGATVMGREVDHYEKVFKSLFLMVPVISTTFASIGLMMENLPPASLGWLLIDEAGQAVPQSAIGGLLRAKRALIVGDPLQIEPVFTTPAKLVEHLCQPLLGEQTADWLPHRVSVQTVADKANGYGCHLEVMDYKQWIGIPLWVHRRCIEPMFSIANQIAYKNRMKHGKQGKDIAQTEHDILGKNRWIDVGGNCNHKQYNPMQTLVLFDLLKTLQFAKTAFNDIYVITPFRAIKQKLREELGQRKDDMMQTLRLTPQEYWSWCRRNVGTVHTFQGKENATVIFLLGCDKHNRGGAVWASSKPNLLNVAVTRAKSNIYFIGDIDVWGEQNFFREVLYHLELER